MKIEKPELENLIGPAKTKAFYDLIAEINSLYDMEQVWGSGGKKWVYEYKFRKSGKTLCAFYFKEHVLGLMLIFGKDERAKVEEIRNELSHAALVAYGNAKTFHDGKWVMFDVTDSSIIGDLKKLLAIKRKPNRK